MEVGLIGDIAMERVGIAAENVGVGISSFIPISDLFLVGPPPPWPTHAPRSVDR
jgi:hypothetical protein